MLPPTPTITFLGLVALDYFQSETKELCNDHPYKTMCGDNSTSCFSPFPQDKRNLFKTGRVDCSSSPNASPYQKYLASGLENQPQQNGNGVMTLEFFDKAFGFKGREALALMGVHTVGGYNTFVVTDNAYNWLRKIQMKLFNNKYYKVLSQRSSKVFDECTGTMEDEKAEAVWTAKTHVLGSVLKKPDPWATADRLGHLRWNQLYLRGPTCQKNTFGYEKDFETWNKRKEIKQAASAAGFNSGIEYCCHEKERGLFISSSACLFVFRLFFIIFFLIKDVLWTIHVIQFAPFARKTRRDILGQTLDFISSGTLTKLVILLGVLDSRIRRLGKILKMRILERKVV